MNIFSVTRKIDLPLMRGAECILCTETVMDKILNRALYTESFPKKTNPYKLCFFGHMSLGKETGSVIPHLICEECSSEVIKQTSLQNIASKCFSCNLVLHGDWRKKYTWDKDTKEFKIESASLPIKPLNLLSLAKRILLAPSIIIGTYPIQFLALLIKTYLEVNKIEELGIQRKITLYTVGITLGMPLAIRMKARGEHPASLLLILFLTAVTIHRHESKKTSTLSAPIQAALAVPISLGIGALLVSIDSIRRRRIRETNS